jgi:hypothetical protein
MTEPNDLLLGEKEVRKAVEKFLSLHQGTFFTINQIANSIDKKAHWITLQKILIDMERIGRVHYQQVGNAHAYAINGRGKWQERFQLNQSTWLFFDTFLGQGGEPFIRVKETKKENNEWVKHGEIMITPDRLPAVIAFLKTVQADIEEYNHVKKMTIGE